MNIISIPVPSGYPNFSENFNFWISLQATFISFGKILLGTPNGFSPISPDGCAPIGLKYLKLAIRQEIGSYQKYPSNSPQ